MSARSLLTVAVICIALAGCGTMPGQPGESKRLPRLGLLIVVPKSTFDECRPGICNLAVYVDDSGSSCSLRVEPKVILFDERTKPKIIRWTMETAGYAFPEGAVTGLPSEEFPNCGPRGQGKLYDCDNRHSRAGAYKYAIRVTGMCRGAAIPVYDPFIVND